MDRPLLNASRMNALRFSLFAGFAYISTACGGEPGAPSGDRSEAVVCPLNAGERAEIERIIEDAHTDASWIATQSPGYKAPVPRAFGAQVPFASLSSLFLVEVVAECSVEMQLEKQCPDGSAVCTQFACEEDGTMLATVSLEALPSVVAASPGPGNIQVSAFEHATRFKRAGEMELGIQWSTRVDIEPDAARKLEINAIGEAEMSGGMLLAYHVDLEVEGYSGGKFTAISDYNGMGLAGMGSVGETPVMLFDTFGSTWIGPCTPGISD